MTSASFMRRGLLVGLLVSCLLTGAYGQSLNTDSRAGFFGGLNFVSQSGEVDRMGHALVDGLSTQYGGAWTASDGVNTVLTFGAFYAINLDAHWALQIEGRFARRGVRFELSGSDLLDGRTTVEFESTLQLDYVELPLLVRYSPRATAIWRPFFMAGPVVGLKIAGCMAWDEEGDTSTVDVAGQYRDMTVGALGSVGISVMLDKTSFVTARVNYFRGLVNPLHDDVLSAKAQDIGFTVGMEFLMGRPSK